MNLRPLTVSDAQSMKCYFHPTDRNQVKQWLVQYNNPCNFVFKGRHAPTINTPLLEILHAEYASNSSTLLAK
jgi:hypothetical protein